MKIHCEYTEIVKREELKPHDLNPNENDEDQIRKLAKMIQYHGWCMPVTVSKRSGFVVRGHGRLLAAEFAGIKDIPVDYQDYDTEDQELADLVADNKIAESSYLDDELTDEIVSTLGGQGFDVELMGFDMADYGKGGENGPEFFSDDKKPGNSAGSVTALPYVFLKDKLSFLVANRELGQWPSGFSIAATWIWAPALFVAAQKGYQQGWVGVFWFTVPNVLCLVVFAFFATKIRRVLPDGFTLSGYILERHSKRVQNCTCWSSSGWPCAALPFSSWPAA